MAGGDSTVVAVQIPQVALPGEAGQATQPSRPLLYHDRTWHALGESSVVQQHRTQVENHEHAGHK